MSKNVATRSSDLTSIQRAAEYAGCNPKTLRRRIADGSLPAVRMGPRMIRVRLSDVEKLMRPVPSVKAG